MSALAQLSTLAQWAILGGVSLALTVVIALWSNWQHRRTNHP